jgi:hypothetical protein
VGGKWRSTWAAGLLINARLVTGKSEGCLSIIVSLALKQDQIPSESSQGGSRYSLNTQEINTVMMALKSNSDQH